MSRRGTSTGIAAVVFALIAALPAAGQPHLADRAAEINACRYLIVPDFSDPYGFANELRTRAQDIGFVVIKSSQEVSSEDDLPKTCVISVTKYPPGVFTVQVLDFLSQSLISEVSAGTTLHPTISGMVHARVANIYRQLAYKGFQEDVFVHKLRRLYPPRPKDEYRLAIVKAPDGSGMDYRALILRSGTPVWEPGEIKAEIRGTASSTIFTSTYFMLNKRTQGVTFVLDHGVVLKGTIETGAGTEDLVLMRVWPTIDSDATGPEEVAAITSSGTGFPVTKSGLIATNWHVVAKAKQIELLFPGLAQPVRADVAVRDVSNDLAILRISDPTKTQPCGDVPFGIVSSNRVTLGQKISTIGYPLEDILGASPKFAEGVVSSTTGLQDDPRAFQVSAQVQPGSSGSPLFNSDGNVIGIVVATLNPAALSQSGALPQNVNWAVKSDYLLNLVGMLPDELPTAGSAAFTPEHAAKCVAIVRAK
jgi:S1-C subfamily serine protease